ncbi:hypothetical protein GCM10010840_07810 [Deinococcus aerolatus]|uniref:Response regulatory domain-containing protein n=1 Tax=Deinococcus aerolatus TaxID=522487 RepID=A0ABQ2G2H5_9DEIO|nr:response regulator [Deinococcus aerolatus]GGL72156.1 hypothetical protein GCM10010840_07810 [Deinococcus aerolatus]
MTGGPQLTTPEGTRRPLQLLVVDDETQILELLDLTLQMRGYAVSLAASGPQALEICRQRDIDVIVMDVLMAPWDGFETVRRLQAQYQAHGGQPSRQMPPVVYLSGLNPPAASSSRGGVVQAYLVKPFRPAELALTIERIWEEWHRTLKTDPT